MRVSEVESRVSSLYSNWTASTYIIFTGFCRKKNQRVDWGTPSFSCNDSIEISSKILKKHQKLTGQKVFVATW